LDEKTALALRKIRAGDGSGFDTLHACLEDVVKIEIKLPAEVARIMTIAETSPRR